MMLIEQNRAILSGNPRFSILIDLNNPVFPKRGVNKKRDMWGERGHDVLPVWSNLSYPISVIHHCKP